MKVIMKYDGNIFAYIAGVMDGDGSFSFIKRKMKCSPLYFPMIQLASSDEGLVDMLIGIFGGRKFVRTKLSKFSKKVSFSWKLEKRIAVLLF